MEKIVYPDSAENQMKDQHHPTISQEQARQGKKALKADVRRFGQSEEVHPGDPISIHQQFGAVHKDEASLEQDHGAEYNIAGDDDFPRD
ncbi:hypothetical protein AAVH_43006 [Aphelenchoides avenae]|nr:hypothetical protein AAVH_43006 [Aphelenchus avenae]